MAVQQWLRKCVYERLPFSKATGAMVTFIVSAFWHGFYEGYYIGFILWFIQIHVAGLIFKWSRNKSNPLMMWYNRTKPVTYIIIWVFWNYMFMHIALYFQVMEYRICLNLFAYFKYFCPVILLTLLVIFTILVGQQKAHHQHKQTDI